MPLKLSNYMFCQYTTKEFLKDYAIKQTTKENKSSQKTIHTNKLEILID